MKKISTLFFFVLIVFIAKAQQNVGIGTTSPHASAALDISSSNKGLLAPRVTMANRPSSPATGLLIYQTDNTPGYYYFDGSSWVRLSINGITGTGSSNALTLWNGTNSVTHNTNLLWNTTNGRLDISGINNGSGTTNWIAANIGGSAGNRVVAGILNGEATIGAHNAALNAWATLQISDVGGIIKMPGIAGTSTQMVTVAANGNLSSQTIPINDNLGNHTATTHINLATNKLVGNGGTTGIAIANNGNVNADGALSITGATTLNNTLNVVGASTLSSTLGVTGATTLNSTLNVTGATTLSNLAGEGNRMVVSNATGVLSTQAIPTGGDNLGNHTATQAINLSNNWISNNGTATGLRVDNAGNVGVNLASPQGVFDVGKVVTGYTGTYSANLSPTAASIYSFSTFGSNVPSNIADGLDASMWQGNTNSSNQVVGFDFGVGITKTIRIYVVQFRGFSADRFDNCSFNFQASHDGSNWTTLDTRSVAGEVSPFNIVRPFTLNNTTAYRHYRIQFTSFVFGTARTPWISELQMSEEIIASNTVSGSFTALSSGNIGVGTNTPTANLDVVGSLRLRNGAANNAILVSDANGNATWNATPSFANATITNATTTNLGVGTASTTSNSITTSGTGGIKVSSSNAGTGATDWIATNVGGQAGDRVVSGILDSKATLGAHNNALANWADLAINPLTTPGATVTIGNTANASPTSTNNTAALNTKLVVNGHVRQGFYALPVSIPANSVITVTWTHNLGYGPILMMSTDENGGGSNMDYCNVTTFNNSTNQTSFKIRNLGGSTATGALRWILVW